MKNKIFLYFFIIGALISPLHADSDDFSTSEPDTTTTNDRRNSTVEEYSVPLNYGNVSVNKSNSSSSNSSNLQSPAENETSVFKPQKIKKKILISNLKNSTDKVLVIDKYEKQPHMRLNGTDEEVAFKFTTKTDEATVVNNTIIVNPGEGRKAKSEEATTGGPTQNDTFELEEEVEEEGRNFQDGDIKRNFKYFNRKNKVTTSTTEKYVTSYIYLTHGQVQKAVNSNYLNTNGDLEKNSKTSTVPFFGTTTALPSNPSSISDSHPVKNLVRLENINDSPSNHTEWVPITPIKTPEFTNMSSETTTVKPPITPPFLKPDSSVTVQKTQVTAIVHTETEPTPSTTTTSNSIPLVDLNEDSSSSSVWKANWTISPVKKIQDIQKLSKFRGSVKFRAPVAYNATVESYDKHNSTRISNVTGDNLQKLEIPPTGSWDLSSVQEFAPVRIFKSTALNKTVVEDVTTQKPTSESVTRPKNIAKVQVMKNTISNKVASDNPMSIFKFSETEPPSNTSKSLETSTVTPTPSISENTTIEDGIQFVFVTVDTNKPHEDDKIETTVPPEIVNTTTLPPGAATNTSEHDMTTMRDESTTTTEEPDTVVTAATETDKEALSTTEDFISETTFRTVTEHDTEMSTETSVDEVPVPPKDPVPVYPKPENKPDTEKGHDIESQDTDSIHVFPNTTEGNSKEEHIPRDDHPPIHPGTHREITEENVPAYLKLTVEAASWEELCRLKDDLKSAIIRMLDGTNVTAEAIVFLNLNDRNCRQKIEESKEEPPSNMPMYLPVNMFIMNENGDFDKNLSEAFLNVWGQYGLDFELPIRKVDFLSPLGGLYDLPNDSVGVSVIAAIIISCVAGLCVILLGILFVIMKRRQKRFNYGQRCTPVSLDAYSLDSVSIHNSVRRKGIRASKRSYGNAAFDDPDVPSHPMNFAGLANFSSDKEQLYEEFNIIPQVYPKTDELPAGAETKNRYANVIPLPETRVHLSVKDGDALSDYINANYVRGLKGAEKLYIACQAPMESTVEDFWRMIWEQQCKVIIMLTDLQENGVEKCTDYLPPNEVTDNLRLFGDFQVTMKKRDVKEKYIISYLKLKNMEANLWREVTHLWYLGWPDQGVPSEANSLIAFLIEARSQMKSQTGSTTQGPAVVHCSPGTGRTGTVIACDLCIREFEKSRMVDIPKCVFNLRKDRAGSVQTKDQYAFIYQVLNVYATKLTGGGLESI